MNVKELDKMIRLGEGFTVEFKTTPSHLGREICALANAAGGSILLGVDDQGHKIGLSKLNRTKSEVQSIARNIDPPLVLEMDVADNILVITVPNGPNKPYSANGLFYIREASNTQQMKRDEIREFFFREGMIRFDEQPCKAFNMRRDVDPERYASFCRSAGIASTLKRNDVLRNLHVLSEEGMKNAGVLLFSKDVSRFFLQASLTCALFQGTTKTKILDRAVFEGDIQQNYNAAISYLVSHLNTEYVIKGGPREEILELPEEALREAVVNAISHRDYRSTSNVQIHIFRDRVEIWNPGGLVPGLKLKDLGRISRPRNLLLFSLMARMDLVEHIGSGIKRIREAVTSYGLKPPLIEAETDWFSITFMRKQTHEAIKKVLEKDAGLVPQEKAQHGGINGGMDGGLNALLEFIRNTPGLRTPQISKAMGVPARTLDKWIKKLKDQGAIEFKGGSRSGGYWKKDLQDGGINGGLSGGINGGISEGMDEGIKALLAFIKQTPGLRAPQISKSLKVKLRTIERMLKHLKEKDVIEFRGSRRFGGYWEK
jgi:ATP-dependent DNA helicase RecG